MKKKIFAVTAILCLTVLILSACGGGSTATSSGETSEISPSEGETASQGETYDVGAFTFELPGGWKAFPQSDVFGEQDEEGNYPIDHTAIYISKNAEDDWDLLSKPAVYIKYYPPTTTIMSSKDWYEDVTELDVAIQGKAADAAFEGKSSIVDDYVYPIIQFSTDNAQFTVNIPTSIKETATGLSWDNADLKMVLESLKGK